MCVSVCMHLHLSCSYVMLYCLLYVIYIFYDSNCCDMAGDEDVVKLTYKQLKEMADGKNREESASGICKLTILLYLSSQ